VRVILDTSAYSRLRVGHPGTARLVREAEAVVFSVIVLGELLAGFRRGTKLERNEAELAEFLASPYVTLLPVTSVTADRFGRVLSDLRNRGRPIPTNDVWIAAHALESGADLVTFDRHFEQVGGLVARFPAG
jgi:tRNA(fMet)-specific endonuclease VapC